MANKKTIGAVLIMALGLTGMVSAFNGFQGFADNAAPMEMHGKAMNAGDYETRMILREQFREQRREQHNAFHEAVLANDYETAKVLAEENGREMPLTEEEFAERSQKANEIAEARANGEVIEGTHTMQMGRGLGKGPRHGMNPIQ